MNQRERIVWELARLGNLFLVLALPELRREGMTYLSLYALQRAVQESDAKYESWFSERELRNESGLKDYEASRACKFLDRTGSVRLIKDANDARERLLIPTARGRSVLKRILKGTSQRLWPSIEGVGRSEQSDEATEKLRKAQQRLLGLIQIAFFENELLGKKPKRTV